MVFDRRAYGREWAKKNPAKIKAAKRRYYENNQEKILAYRALYTSREKKKLLAIKRSWEQRNPGMLAMIRVRRRIKQMHGQGWVDMHGRYGISWEEYQQIEAMQGGVCAICLAPQQITKKATRLFVDHDHKNGAPRALLCQLCNAGLGYFHENGLLFMRAIAYLEGFNAATEKDWIGRVRSVLGFLSKEGCQAGCAESVVQVGDVARSSGQNIEGAGSGESIGAMAQG